MSFQRAYVEDHATCSILNVACTSDFNQIVSAPQKVIVMQEPTESLFLTLIIIKSEKYNEDEQGTEKYYCDLYLKFLNDLHHVSQDYVYRITLKACVKDENTYLTHELFSHNEIRALDKMILTEICYMKNHVINCAKSSPESFHICFNIRRYNFRKSLTKTVPSNNVMMLLKHGLVSDVVLEVGEKIFRAHKQILASRSTVFKQMFAHDMAENIEGVVRIEDFEPEVIEEMLSYIYTDHAYNISQYYRELFKAAHKYDIGNLKAECEEYFLFDMNLKNVVSIIDLAHLYDHRYLEEAAMSYLRNFEHFDVCTLPSLLKLCEKYELRELKVKALDFLKTHSKDFVNHSEFLDLFETHPKLMKEAFIYMHK